MKKIFILAIISFTFLACEPTPTVVNPEVYPTDSLVVSNDQKAFVLETTGTWCQYCPNGAAAMLEVQTTHNVDNIKVIGFASHSGDPLVTPVQDLLNTTFPTSGVPNFYVNNADVGQSISGPVASALSATAPVGVSHVSSQVGDSMVVDVKVEFFEEKKNIAYYVQSYVLVTEIIAKEYPDLGGLPVDLNQVSSVSIVTTGSGSTPTQWAVDTWGKKAGDPYTHDHIPVTSGNTPFEWGVTLDTINPLGQAYFEGDIFGSKYTPIQIKVPLTIQGMTLPPNLKYEVVTIIWSERFDGSPGVLFVNGFQG